MISMVALFPTRQLGIELGSILLIFTGQVWNMAFSFYSSLKAIPREMHEAAQVYRWSWWQKFFQMELPYSAIGLIWNSMMSFGGGWFFVAQSEAISVMNKDIKLPGLGSYMAQAIERGDRRAAFWAVVAMIVLILASDQLVWRPMLAWADKFKIELTESTTPATSWVYNLLRGAYLFTWLKQRVWQPLGEMMARPPGRRARGPGQLEIGVRRLLARAAAGLLLIWIGFEVLTGVLAAVAALHAAMTRPHSMRLSGPHALKTPIVPCSTT